MSWIKQLLNTNQLPLLRKELTSKQFYCPFHPLGWTLLESVNVNGKVNVSVHVYVGNGSCNFPSDLFFRLIS